MNDDEKRRLIIVEEYQKNIDERFDNFNDRFDKLTKKLETNTKITMQTQRTLDELTGAKKFLVWFTSFVVGIGIIIATILGYKKK